jgi:hypothetical protein
MNASSAITENVQENVILHDNNDFLFLQSMCWNLTFLTAEKISLKKNRTFFAIGPIVLLHVPKHERQN